MFRDAKIENHELDQRHKEVPVDYYEKGINNNFFQWIWHRRCFNLIEDEIKALSVKGKILDLGCHSGDRTNIIHLASGCQVVGLDISPKAIEYAKSRFSNITFFCNNFPLNSPFSDNEFEAITALDVLEHLPDLSIVIAEIKRLLAPGGYLIIGVPNENILFKVAWYFWLKLRGRVWEGVHVHDFRQEGFKIFQVNGFKKISEKRIIFHMWYFTVFKNEK